MARIEAELLAKGAAKPWRAYFVSALAIAWPDGHVETFEGRVDGDLIFPPRGARGFGYDPCFQPDGHDRTFGEMTAEEKHGLPRTARTRSRTARAPFRRWRARAFKASIISLEPVIARSEATKQSMRPLRPILAAGDLTAMVCFASLAMTGQLNICML